MDYIKRYRVLSVFFARSPFRTWILMTKLHFPFGISTDEQLVGKFHVTLLV